MTREKVTLVLLTPGKTPVGIPTATPKNDVDFYGAVLQGDSEIVQRQQGTIVKRKFTVYVKGRLPSEDIVPGNALLIRDATCIINDVVIYPNKLVQISATERL